MSLILCLIYYMGDYCLQRNLLFTKEIIVYMSLMLDLIYYTAPTFHSDDAEEPQRPRPTVMEQFLNPKP